MFRFVSIFLKNIELINDIKKQHGVTIDIENSLDKKVSLTTCDLWDFTEKIYNDCYNKHLFSIAKARYLKKTQYKEIIKN